MLRIFDRSAKAAALAKRATRATLTGPAWDIHIELCDIICKNPGQAKDALKVLKGRLGNKSPKVQLLSLDVLETLTANCRDSISKGIVDQGILREMVEIVRKRRDIHVREKILVLIVALKDDFGKAEYGDACQKLRRAAGFKLPPHTVNNAPLFAPPQSHPTVDERDAAEEASLQPDVPVVRASSDSSHEAIIVHDYTTRSESPASYSSTRTRQFSLPPPRADTSRRSSHPVKPREQLTLHLSLPPPRADTSRRSSHPVKPREQLKRQLSLSPPRTDTPRRSSREQLKRQLSLSPPWRSSHPVKTREQLKRQFSLPRPGHSPIASGRSTRR